MILPLNWLSEDPANCPKRIVDVGCGIGGSSRYLTRKYGAKCQGITLSPVQAERANVLAKAEGLADKVCAKLSVLFLSSLYPVHIQGKFILTTLIISLHNRFQLLK